MRKKVKVVNGELTISIKAFVIWSDVLQQQAAFHTPHMAASVWLTKYGAETALDKLNIELKKDQEWVDKLPSQSNFKSPNIQSGFKEVTAFLEKYKNADWKIKQVKVV